MAFELNKEIVSNVVDEFIRTFYHSRKSRNEIFETLFTQSPQITCSDEKWSNFSQEVKENIIGRIQESLVAM